MYLTGPKMDSNIKLSVQLKLKILGQIPTNHLLVSLANQDIRNFEEIRVKKFVFDLEDQNN